MKCVPPIIALVYILVFVVICPLRAAADATADRRALKRFAATSLGLPPAPSPADNEPTIKKIALGRKLFFDRRLSFNKTLSCGMCHIPEQGFTNNELETPVGFEGRSVRRNAPTVINAAYVEHVFHDGREGSLEAQVLRPLVDANEMANPSLDHVVARIASLEDYDSMFEQTFGGGPTAKRISRAIASWERTLIAAGSPFDRWHYGGDDDAVTEEQKRGFDVFTGKGLCVSCHHIGTEDALFTDNAFHDTGIGYFDHEIDRISSAPVPVEIEPGVAIPVARAFVATISGKKPVDFGRFEVTGLEEDKWRFKTPSLRNVALTAPYMHDGSLPTLDEVVRFYSRGGIPHAGLDPLIRPLNLSDDEVRALVAFLEALTSPAVEELIGDARSVPVGN